MNRRIEILWDPPTPRKTLEGKVLITEGNDAMEMKTIAEFSIEKHRAGQRTFCLGGEHLPELSERTHELISMMASAYFQGVNQGPAIYMWEKIS